MENKHQAVVQNSKDGRWILRPNNNLKSVKQFNKLRTRIGDKNLKFDQDVDTAKIITDKICSSLEAKEVAKSKL